MADAFKLAFSPFAAPRRGVLAVFCDENLKLGVGIRAGYTLPQNVYVGGTFVYHFGTSSETTVAGRTVGASMHLFYPAAEAGYDIRFGRALVRPYAGVGMLFASATIKGLNGQDASASNTSLGIFPGVTASYDVPRSNVFVGADLRLLFSTEGGDPSLGAFVTGGMRF